MIYPPTMAGWQLRPAAIGWLATPSTVIGVSVEIDY
jgi:hypothetical protein